MIYYEFNNTLKIALDVVLRQTLIFNVLVILRILCILCMILWILVLSWWLQDKSFYFMVRWCWKWLFGVSCFLLENSYCLWVIVWKWWFYVMNCTTNGKSGNSSLAHAYFGARGDQTIMEYGNGRYIPSGQGVIKQSWNTVTEGTFFITLLRFLLHFLRQLWHANTVHPAPITSSLTLLRRWNNMLLSSSLFHIFGQRASRWPLVSLSCPFVRSCVCSFVRNAKIFQRTYYLILIWFYLVRTRSLHGAVENACFTKF